MKRTLMGAGAIIITLAALSAQEKDYVPSCTMCPGTYIPNAEIQAYVKRGYANQLTDQGIRHWKDTVVRAENYWAAIKKSGGRVIQEVWTTGEYDIITLFEAPDDETAAALTLQASALGNVRMSTMRAFTADEVKRIVAKTQT